MRNLLFVGLCTILFAPAPSIAASPQEELAKLAAEGNGVIRLNPSTYDLLTSPKRTWSASVHFTAMDERRRCHPCKQFDPVWLAVAKAWSQTSSNHRNEHFFATLDFDEAPAVFQKLGLVSAPVVFTYPPEAGNRKPASGKTSPIKYDFGEGFDPGPLAEVISKFTPVPIPYKDPIDWTRWAIVAVGVLGAALFLRFMTPLVQNRWLWAAITVITILIMTGGFMFARIRNVPYTGANGQWVAAGFSHQFGQEVQVVAFIYGLLAFAYVMLIMVVPYQTSPQRQRMQIYLWTAVIMIMYSVLVSLFKIKNGGYPFRLFL